MTMEQTQKDAQDKRVLNLAADISYADEKSISRLLLQIQGLDVNLIGKKTDATK